VFPNPRADERLSTPIPSAGEQVRIEGAAHFLQEDRGERIAELVAKFVRGSPGA
jgi:haloalkane dehalogenase